MSAAEIFLRYKYFNKKKNVFLGSQMLVLDAFRDWFYSLLYRNTQVYVNTKSNFNFARANWHLLYYY